MRPDRRRRQREPLNPAKIADVALKMIEAQGLDRFSMRSLAVELGVEPMSLYHHVPSKAHLLDAILNRLVAELSVPPATVPWRERVRTAALSYRGVCLRYPEFSRYLLVHRMNTPPALAYLERVVQLFVDAGFDRERAARSFRLLGYYLMGAVLDETMGYAKGPTAADPVPLDQQAKIAPVLISMAPYFQEAEREATFLAGLDIILDGFERDRPMTEAGGSRRQSRSPVGGAAPPPGTSTP